MGFLDFLDNMKWDQVFGGDTASAFGMGGGGGAGGGAGGGQQPPAQPPQEVLNTRQPFGTSAFDSGNMPSAGIVGQQGPFSVPMPRSRPESAPLSFNDRYQPVDATNDAVGNDAKFASPGDSRYGAATDTRLAGATLGANGYATIPGGPQPPAPSDDGDIQVARTSGPPGSVQSAPMPNINPYASPQGLLGNGMAAQLGLGPVPPMPKAGGPGQTFRSSLGAGLSAVGGAPAGTSAGQMAALGFGGAMKGGVSREEKQFAEEKGLHESGVSENLKARAADLANVQASIKHRMMEQNISFSQAKMQVLALEQAQGRSRTAWQQSDAGRYHLAQTEIQKERTAQTQLYRDELKQATLEGDQERLARIRKAIDEAVEKKRKESYQFYRLDPATAEEKAKRGFIGTPEQIKHLPSGTPYWDPIAKKTRIRKSDADSTPVSPLQTQAAMQGEPQQKEEGPEDYSSFAT